MQARSCALYMQREPTWNGSAWGRLPIKTEQGEGVTLKPHTALLCHGYNYRNASLPKWCTAMNAFFQKIKPVVLAVVIADCSCYCIRRKGRAFNIMYDAPVSWGHRLLCKKWRWYLKGLGKYIRAEWQLPPQKLASCFLSIPQSLN